MDWKKINDSFHLKIIIYQNKSDDDQTATDTKVIFLLFHVFLLHFPTDLHRGDGDGVHGVLGQARGLQQHPGHQLTAAKPAARSVQPRDRVQDWSADDTSTEREKSPARHVYVLYEVTWL